MLISAKVGVLFFSFLNYYYYLKKRGDKLFFCSFIHLFIYWYLEKNWRDCYAGPFAEVGGPREPGPTCVRWSITAQLCINSETQSGNAVGGSVCIQKGAVITTSTITSFCFSKICIRFTGSKQETVPVKIVGLIQRVPLCTSFHNERATFWVPTENAEHQTHSLCGCASRPYLSISG